MRRLAPLVAGAAFGAWSSWQAGAGYNAVPVVPPGAPGGAAPGGTAGTLVSVVIPARNEARNLPRLLVSLRHLAPVEAHEVIVVDDASTDATAELAMALGARTLRLAERDLPAGWTGKCNACWRGAQVARGDWLLFLDADTAFEAPALRDTLAHALARDLDALSVLLRQRCESLWERLLLPFAYQQLFAGLGRQGLTRSDPQQAILNGQFVLIRRRVYDAVGGHGAPPVRRSVLEDVALGRLLAGRGYRIATLRGEHLGSVRMYRDLPSLREGFGKNAYAFLSGSPARGLRVALSSAGAGMALPLLLEGAALARRRPLAGGAVLAAGGVAWAALGAGLATWGTRFGVPGRYALAQPVAATVFNAIAVESSLRCLSGRTVTWKGRAYRVDGEGAGGGAETGWLTPAPRMPSHVLLALGRAMVRREPFPLAWGSAGYVQQLAGRWEAFGLEHIPRRGPVCFVLNHWQRRELWIGWSGTLLNVLVAQARPGDEPPVHWLVLGELRLPLLGRERHLAAGDLVLRRVAQACQMVPLSLAPGATVQRAGALRTLRRLATAGRAVAFFPEGHGGGAGPLGQPLPGAGRFLAWMARSGVAVVPVAIHESGGRLVLRVGPQIGAGLAGAADAAAAATAMSSLAGLLPPAYRGPWSGAVGAPVGAPTVSARWDLRARLPDGDVGTTLG